MNKEDYSKLDNDAKYNFLSSELAAGKDFNEVLENIGINKTDLIKQGFYIVKGKIMRKPGERYGTPK